MGTFMDEVKAKLAGRKAGMPNGQLVMERRIDKPVNGNHFYYGNENSNAVEVAQAAAAGRALKENMLRQAYDQNKKAFRVTCIDEKF